MTDLRFLSCDENRKERQSTRRVCKPRKSSMAEMGLYSYKLVIQRKEDTCNELIADKFRREVSTSMLYRWFKQNMKDVLRT